MATRFREAQKPPPKVLEIIVGLFHRVAHPMYLGIVSLDIGYSLAQTQAMFDVLENTGVIRPATPEEKAQSGIRADGNVYVLTEKPTPSKARW